MEHRLNWISGDKSILLVEFIDTWTWDDLHQVMQDINVLTANNLSQLHLILKFEVHPILSNPINQFSELARKRPQNVIDIFMVIPTLPSIACAFFGSLTSLIDKIYGQKEPIAVVYSVDEACKLIEYQAVHS